MNDLTRILSAIEQGDSQAAEQLLPLVYEELRHLAAAKLASEKPGQTLQATALVHEAYLRIVDVNVPQEWNGRGHFFAAAAEAMRRILVEAARGKASARRGAGRRGRELLDGDLMTYGISDEILDLDEALTKLGALDEQGAELVKLRAFGGMTVEEAARHLGISSRTAKRSWAYARAWLGRELASDDGGVG
jgi:RNA polymerase sigma factor (TIGR02999 family)